MSEDVTCWEQLPDAPAPGTILGAQEEVVDGGAQFYSLGEGKSPFRIVVLRSGANLFAYVNRCAHFGVPLAARLEQFKFEAHVSLTCNVHYARFRWQDGYCDRGDCLGESLLAVPVEVCEGMIRIAG